MALTKVIGDGTGTLNSATVSGNKLVVLMVMRVIQDLLF